MVVQEARDQPVPRDQRAREVPMEVLASRERL